MGKFVVIDKEKVERSEHSELIKTAISLLIKHGVATELSTDESIETVIEKILQPNVLRLCVRLRSVGVERSGSLHKTAVIGSMDF